MLKVSIQMRENTHVCIKSWENVQSEQSNKEKYARGNSALKKKNFKSRHLK